MNNYKKITILLFFFFLIAGCSDNSKTKPQTVIQIDHQVLTLTQFDEFFEPLRMSYATDNGDNGNSLLEARSRFLLQLIEEMIILRRAEEINLHVSPQELEEALGKIEGGYDKESLQDTFMKQAISMDTWKERVRRQLLVEKVVHKELSEGISVTPEEMRQYYDENRGEWSLGERVRVSQILLPSKEQAEQILAQIKKGEDFATLAIHNSEAPESEQGGDMGYVVRGHLPESLESPIFSLKKDEVSPVVKTPYGYHIFKVVDRKPAGKPGMDDWIDTVREQVKQDKIETAYGPWLARLRSRYKINVNKGII
jgi:peptidyl-prolyl cis-trans isomerase C/foldase protein PrsA